jgi:hypothetical protein
MTVAEITAGLADTRQRLARLIRLRRGTVEGDERWQFILTSAAELLSNPHLRPTTSAKLVARWNRRHCRPPLRADVVSSLAEVAGADWRET